MFRPVSHLVRRVPSCSVEIVRRKVIYPALTLSRAERIKQWNKDNKDLFGPLLESAKEKKKRNKPAKNRQPASSATDIDGDSVLNNSAGNATKSLESQKLGYSVKNIQNMWSNARNGVILGSKLTNVRGLKTVVNKNAAQNPSAVDPGFASEDKILQIKPHKNDYSQEYPSVTLILNKTMTEESKAALEKWKQERIAEMGIEEFNKFYEAQMAVGTKFHATLKRYFTEPQNKLRIEKDVEGVWNSVGELLKSVSSPKAIESNVIHPVLKYRGIFDAIADYEDKPTLIEWKKSDKPRKAISLTYDNPVQLAAYFGAVSNDLNYKHLNVRDALLVIAYTDGSKADVYHLTVDKLREHWAHWLSRLENYASKHSADTEKILKGGKRLFEEDIGNLQ